MKPPLLLQFLLLVVLVLLVLVLVVLLLVLDLLLLLLVLLRSHKASGALLAPLGRIFRLAAAASPLRLPRALLPAHHAYRLLLEVDCLARWTRQLASCNPCTGSGCAGARRWLTRRNPCTGSGCAGARRCFPRRNPCTCSVRAGARRRPIRRNPCTGTSPVCAGTASSACAQRPSCSPLLL